MQQGHIQSCILGQSGWGIKATTLQLCPKLVLKILLPGYQFQSKDITVIDPLNLSLLVTG